LTRSQATTEVNQIACLSTGKGSLEQKVNLAVAHRKGYYTSAHFLFPGTNNIARYCGQQECLRERPG
ncbi:MAG: hypothetical protein QNL87_10115, partial [Gammaproteobacteria bacterium]|nr:hypothetical protein [Gammaproteobacteria bacterium]